MHTVVIHTSLLQSKQHILTVAKKYFPLLEKKKKIITVERKGWSHGRFGGWGGYGIVPVPASSQERKGLVPQTSVKGLACETRYGRQ